jgi:hypothetical protein
MGDRCTGDGPLPIRVENESVRRLIEHARFPLAFAVASDETVSEVVCGRNGVSDSSKGWFDPVHVVNTPESIGGDMTREGSQLCLWSVGEDISYWIALWVIVKSKNEFTHTKQ